jgi:CheY-like chemotaxis protein
MLTMPGDKAKAIPLLDVLRAAGPIAAPTMLRIALDVLEPIAASTVSAPVGVRRDGSRHEIANVVVGIRGKAKLVGRGNRSGIQVLLWEMLAGRGAPVDGGADPLRGPSRAMPPPLSAVVEDAEAEVAEVVDAAVSGREDLADARALLKALVIASAGLVGTHREVAKAVAVAAAHPVSAPPLPQPAKSTILPPPTATTSVPQPLGLSLVPELENDPMAAELDAVLSLELDRLAPHGWDDWEIAEAKPKIEDPATMDGDALIQELGADDVVEAKTRPPLARVAPPLPNAVPLGGSGAARSDVLMIEPDAFTSAHLGGVLRRAGYSVEICADPEQAVARACAVQPRIVLCDDEGVSGKAASIALAARTNSPRACLAPFVFLVGRAHHPEASKARGGARDVFLEKPFSTDALLEHVAKFVGPATAKADSSMLPPLGETAMDGSLSLISLRTLVSMLELERKSGVLTITSRGREAAITLRDGRATRARVQGRKVGAAMALETLLSWDDGRFTFQHTLAGAEQPVMADGARSH